MRKKDLDRLGTLLGLIAGISGVLVSNQVVDPKVGGTVSGIATVFLGVVVQHPAEE